MSRSGYYDWLKREPSNRTCEDRALKIEIQKIYDKVEGRYGSPRIWKELQKRGVATSKKRVARLMQELGLIARVTRVT
ncbi:IS3 family transposase, partial [Zhongshania sp. BJYM1]|uniref:IS3 family transposase n=1 Tax=Zhongshania aquatica TaxID=2965069 RepID=UPI0022B3486E